MRLLGLMGWNETILQQEGHEFEEHGAECMNRTFASPKNSYVEALTPNVMAFGGGPLKGN